MPPWFQILPSRTLGIHSISSPFFFHETILAPKVSTAIELQAFDTITISPSGGQIDILATGSPVRSGQMRSCDVSAGIATRKTAKQKQK
jgi:hypothetical protein